MLEYFNLLESSDFEFALNSEVNDCDATPKESIWLYITDISIVIKSSIQVKFHYLIKIHNTFLNK